MDRTESFSFDETVIDLQRRCIPCQKLLAICSFLISSIPLPQVGMDVLRTSLRHCIVTLAGTMYAGIWLLLVSPQAVIPHSPIKFFRMSFRAHSRRSYILSFLRSPRFSPSISSSILPRPLHLRYASRGMYAPLRKIQNCLRQLHPQVRANQKRRLQHRYPCRTTLDPRAPLQKPKPLASASASPRVKTEDFPSLFFPAHSHPKQCLAAHRFSTRATRLQAASVDTVGSSAGARPPPGTKETLLPQGQVIHRLRHLQRLPMPRETLPGAHRLTPLHHHRICFRKPHGAS